ncbi:MAG: GNAT family N-acetyltransferase [Alphaproteobacteria bacterium]|nr:GNAT family N-acetyltransferase [Alphaproteobacteria bacterium]
MSGSKTATGGNSPRPVVVRRLTEADHAAWLSMRQALWMGTDATTRAAEDMTLFTEPERFGAIRYEALVALVEDRPAGFVEVSLRDDVEGFRERTVGYIEGIFVEMNFRHGGVGHILIEAAAAWTRSAGAAELVSDAAGEDLDSIAFHRACGFSVARETVQQDKPRIVLARTV